MGEMKIQTLVIAPWGSLLGCSAGPFSCKKYHSDLLGKGPGQGLFRLAFFATPLAGHTQAMKRQTKKEPTRRPGR